MLFLRPRRQTGLDRLWRRESKVDDGGKSIGKEKEMSASLLIFWWSSVESNDGVRGRHPGYCELCLKHFQATEGMKFRLTSTSSHPPVTTV